MAREYMQGKYRVKNTSKYVGDYTNVIFRSSWELQYMIWCDTNPAILQWSSETVVIPYFKQIDNKVHRYFVDFWMRVKDKSGKITTYLVEVKPYSQTIPPVNPTGRKKKTTLLNETATYLTNQDKWKACRSYCDKRGWKFVIITERELGLNKSSNK